MLEARLAIVEHDRHIPAMHVEAAPPAGEEHFPNHLQWSHAPDGGALGQKQGKAPPAHITATFPLRTWKLCRLLGVAVRGQGVRLRAIFRFFLTEEPGGVYPGKTPPAHITLTASPFHAQAQLDSAR